MMGDLSDESIAKARAEQNKAPSPRSSQETAFKSSLSKESVDAEIHAKPPLIPEDTASSLKNLARLVVEGILGEKKIAHDPRFNETSLPNCWDAVNGLPPKQNQSTQLCVKGPER